MQFLPRYFNGVLIVMTADTLSAFLSVHSLVKGRLNFYPDYIYAPYIRVYNLYCIRPYGLYPCDVARLSGSVNSLTALAEFLSVSLAKSSKFRYTR